MAAHPGIFYRENSPIDEAGHIIVGIPWDGTVSGRPGTRFGPLSIRTATLGVEDYSPYQHRDISDLKIFDAGDIEIPVGDSTAVLTAIRKEYSRLTNENASLVTLGGEHLISLPLVQIMHEKYGDDLFVVQFDAHADLRTDYLGVEFSHATVMHHVSGLLGVDNTAAIGIRSGSRDEWEQLRRHPNYFGGASGRVVGDIGAFAKKLAGRKLYITCDLDVFDPGIMPGTGTPEPGGISFSDFIALLQNFEGCDIIGADVVELAPDYDSSGISSVLAATVLREIMLIMEK